jgi:hypothetical protein
MQQFNWLCQLTNAIDGVNCLLMYLLFVPLSRIHVSIDLHEPQRHRYMRTQILVTSKHFRHFLAATGTTKMSVVCLKQTTFSQNLASYFCCRR